MGLGTSRRLQRKHERLWVDEVVKLHYMLLGTNELRSFQATDPNNIVKFHGILVDRLLSDRVLDDLRNHGNSKRAPNVPGGTPCSVDYN